MIIFLSLLFPSITSFKLLNFISLIGVEFVKLLLLKPNKLKWPDWIFLGISLEAGKYSSLSSSIGSVTLILLFELELLSFISSLLLL